MLADRSVIAVCPNLHKNLLAFRVVGTGKKRLGRNTLT